jgi:hypothetical protein
VRTENWNPNREDQTFEDIAMDRIQLGASVLKVSVLRRLKSSLGYGWQGVRESEVRRSPGKKLGVSRAVYQRAYDGHTVPGKKFKYPHYTGAEWTARDYGMMATSIRTVRKLTPSGKALSSKRSIRVYAGTYHEFYAAILEFYRPFMRPAFNDSISSIKNAVGAS